MEQNERKGWPWGRSALAILLALMFVAAILPSTGRIVVDQTTTPPTRKIVGQARAGLVLVGIVAVPLACIFFGMRRRPGLEAVGWVFLIFMVGSIFIR